MKQENPDPIELVSSRSSGKTGWVIGGSLFTIALVLYLFLCRIPFGGIPTETKAISFVKQLLLGCRAYAADHEGDCPPNLGALYPDYVDYPELFFAKDSKGNDIPILYYPGLTEADAGAMLIEYPVQFGGNRIIGTVGGHVLRKPVE